MEKRPITLKDIAKALDLSTSTVSRAMKGHPAISEETRKLVQQYAEEHKYKPNTLALSLRTNKSNTIGVIVPEIVHFFFSSVLAGIQVEAASENYHLLMCNSNEMYDREVKSVQTLLDAACVAFWRRCRRNTSNTGIFKTSSTTMFICGFRSDLSRNQYRQGGGRRLSGRICGC
jgi:DNA-binding LacI/PurR family transcriptional regulator